MSKLLAVLAISAGLSTTLAADTLNSKFISHGKKFWGDFFSASDVNIPGACNAVRTDFGGLKPDSVLSWAATEKTRGSFDFSQGNTVVNWAISNGKTVRGSPIVWNSQLPSWVNQITDKATLTTVIQTHVSKLIGQYKGKFYLGCREGCSEALNEDGTLKASVFYNVLGESFIKIAFQAARSADPTAKLYINDYNLESNTVKRQAMIALVGRINSSGILIDGIGAEFRDNASSDNYLTTLTSLAGTGAEVAITSLTSSSINTYILASRACLSTSLCVSVVTHEVALISSGQTSILYDSKYQPTAAYYTLLAAL